VYPDERVTRFVSERFIPVRVHVKENVEAFQELGDRYAAYWTPTILELDASGQERHRVEGFLDAPALLAQLTLGLGKMAFDARRFDEAERYYREVVERYPDSEAAPEALYWAGAARYKGTGNANALAETAKAFENRYRDSPWATKASVWKS
jgi:tetratricopeptide (TPR) repeat protein